MLCNNLFYTRNNSDMTKTLELAVAEAAALPEAAQERIALDDRSGVVTCRSCSPLADAGNAPFGENGQSR